ncbi:hypothetical protein BS47DRAFT_1342892 [Hydnum rufescens UP504]|uniref:Uncharacterized protein n=1 Tax=Hydnum rufescens UP504 TaxID=1448309 RepID=A0A9P6AYY4_9AGAM|nr:hypothetical protein BS47DRAFT_1342892 [Hydnum rufescens UP504]
MGSPLHFIPPILALSILGFVYYSRRRSNERRGLNVPKLEIITKSIYHSNVEKGIEDPNFIPDPKPILDFDLKTARTRDYVHVNKTLRYPYYQTMAHQPLEIENWIEISSDYEWYLSEKKRVIQEQGTVVLDSLPENDFACQELLETVVDWLPKRYPSLFNRLLRNDTSGNPLSDGIFSKTTGETYVWDIGAAPEGKVALQILSRLTECDFLMAREREDGHVYFVGGLVAFPGFYLLSEKIGKPMQEVHAPVPQFNQKLLISVERTLKRMHPSAPFERSSWELVDDYELFQHNISKLPEGGKVDVKPEDLLLRIDRQTFRKLPKSRGIIFGVHPLLCTLGSLTKSPSSLHSCTRFIPIVAPAYWDALGPWLEEKTHEQIRSGLIGDGDLERVQDFRKFESDDSR